MVDDSAVETHHIRDEAVEVARPRPDVEEAHSVLLTEVKGLEDSGVDVRSRDVNEAVLVRSGQEMREQPAQSSEAPVCIGLDEIHGLVDHKETSIDGLDDRSPLFYSSLKTHVIGSAYLIMRGVEYSIVLKLLNELLMGVAIGSPGHPRSVSWLAERIASSSLNLDLETLDISVQNQRGYLSAQR